MTGGTTARRAGCLTAAVILAGTSLFATATAAQAAVGDGPGGLTLNPASGATTADPIAQYASASACPAAFRSTAAVGILTDEPALITLTGNFGPTATPPSGTLDEGQGLGKVMEGAGLGTGAYQIALVCFNGSFEINVPANVWIHADLTAKTWNVITGTPGAVTTTTTLNAQPTTVQAGDAVALTASVTGIGAAGTVEFLDGATSLGSATVANGTATKSVSTLAAGQHSLTAKFVPTDPAAFKASTSGAVTVNVTNGTGGGTGGQTVHVTVPQGGGGGGDLTLEVGSTPVNLAPVSGEDLEFKGDLSPVKVTDGRDQLAGWQVTGATTDFTGGSNKIDGNQLGWAPKVVTQNAAGDVVAGSAVAPAAPGLKSAATLASAAAGKGKGASTLGSTLDLEVPAETPAGDYAATLTVTLMSK